MFFYAEKYVFCAILLVILKKEPESLPLRGTADRIDMLEEQLLGFKSYSAADIAWQLQFRDSRILSGSSGRNTA